MFRVKITEGHKPFDSNLKGYVDICELRTVETRQDAYKVIGMWFGGEVPDSDIEACAFEGKPITYDDRWTDRWIQYIATVKRTV